MNNKTFTLYVEDYYFFMVGKAEKFHYYPNYDGTFFENMYETNDHLLCIRTRSNAEVRIEVKWVDKQPVRLRNKADHVIEASLEIQDELWIMNNDNEVDEPEKIKAISGIYRVRVSSYHLAEEKQKYTIELWKINEQTQPVILKQFEGIEPDLPPAYIPPNDKSGHCELKDIKKHLTMPVLLPQTIPLKQLFEEDVFYMVVQDYEHVEIKTGGIGGYNFFFTAYQYEDINDVEFEGTEKVSLFSQDDGVYVLDIDTCRYEEPNGKFEQRSKIENLQFIKDHIFYDITYYHPAHEEDAKQMLIDFIRLMQK